MNNLDQSINALERELALKKGYQSVKFVLPKSTPDDVAQEIQTKLREIADSLALKPGVDYGALEPRIMVAFTDAEVETLKMVAQTVLQKQNGKGDTAQGITPTVGDKQTASPGGASVHTKQDYGPARKARVLTAENVRGEGRKFTAPEDELWIPNPEKVDDHGMVSATHMKRGAMIKIPLDDVEFVS